MQSVKKMKIFGVKIHQWRSRAAIININDGNSINENNVNKYRNMSVLLISYV